MAHYCEDCIHFIPDEKSGKASFDGLCELNKHLEFKSPSGYLDIQMHDWGFYNKTCKEYKKDNELEETNYDQNYEINVIPFNHD